MLQISTSFRHFLYDTDNPIAKWILKAEYQFGWGNGVYRFMVRWDEVNYLTLRDDGTISYLPKGKEHKTTDDGKWARDGRQNGRPAAIIRKVLPKKVLKLFKDSDFEAFANRYKAAAEASRRRFDLLPAEKIPWVYDYSPIEEGGGTLNNSCMNGDGRMLDIYKNCPFLQILSLWDPKEHTLCGRALVWQIGDETLMDRVYVTKDSYYDLFLDYASDNGWVRKSSYKSAGNKTTFVKNGDTYEKVYKIALPTEYERYPYIDTFQYGGDGWLTNINDGNEYEYSCTSGERVYVNRPEYVCAITGEGMDEDDAVYIQRGRYRDEYIHRDHAVYCVTDCNYYYEHDSEIVEVNNRYYRTDDEDVCCDMDGDWVMREDCSWCEYLNEYVLEEYTIWSDFREDNLLLTDAVRVDGKIYHKDDVEQLG
jgi:hypothetical protein